MPISITFVSFARTESALHNSVFTYTTCNVLGLCKRLVRCILLIWLTQELVITGVSVSVCQGLTAHERGSDDSSDSRFSILNSEKSIVKLVEIHRVLGSEYLVQY